MSISGCFLGLFWNHLI